MAARHAGRGGGAAGGRAPDHLEHARPRRADAQRGAEHGDARDAADRGPAPGAHRSHPRRGAPRGPRARAGDDAGRGRGSRPGRLLDDRRRHGRACRGRRHGREPGPGERMGGDGGARARADRDPRSGALRQQWIIAAYAPIEAPQAKAAAASPAWAVGYQSLDALLVRAGFGRVVKDGFAFQINQTDPLTHGVRELFGSRPDMPSDAVASAIRAPAAFSPPNASAYLQLALRPRTGWYPTGDLVSRTGLLLLLAWALVFGAHELTASLDRTQSEIGRAS